MSIYTLGILKDDFSFSDVKVATGQTPLFFATPETFE